MKYYFLLAFLFALTHTYAKNVSGYIVTLKNDTVPVQIKIGGGFFFGIGRHDLNKEVETVDSVGNSKTYIPDSIMAFGYTDKSEETIYRVKPIKDGSRLFLRAIVIGEKASLYQYEVSSTGPYSSSTEEFYTFEKPDGSHLFLKNYDMLNTLRDKLKDFYSEKPEIGQLIDKKFKTRGAIQRDIRGILEAINQSRADILVQSGSSSVDSYHFSIIYFRIRCRAVHSAFPARSAGLPLPYRQAGRAYLDPPS
jgi:hypothetical protein